MYHLLGCMGFSSIGFVFLGLALKAHLVTKRRSDFVAYGLLTVVHYAMAIAYLCTASWGQLDVLKLVAAVAMFGVALAIFGSMTRTDTYPMPMPGDIDR